MGTYAENTRTNITLDLNRLRQGYCNKDPEFATLLDVCCCNWDSSFPSFCKNLAYKTKEDQQTSKLIIQQVADSDKIGWHDAYFAALAPFAQEGDYAEFRSEYGEVWRYIRHGGKFIEQTGTVTVEYPPLPALPKPKARKAKRG